MISKANPFSLGDENEALEVRETQLKKRTKGKAKRAQNEAKMLKRIQSLEKKEQELVQQLKVIRTRLKKDQSLLKEVQENRKRQEVMADLESKAKKAGLSLWEYIEQLSKSGTS